MSIPVDRLRRGTRWWAAELMLRAIGVALLLGCCKLGLQANRLVLMQPSHQATLREFATCAATFLALASGLALTFEGPGLFRQVPIPPRSAFF